MEITITSRAAGRPLQPIGEENVSGSTAGSRDQGWHFFPWGESSRLCSREEGVPKTFMSVDTVSVPPTAHLVVSKRVCGSLPHAEGAS